MLKTEDMKLGIDYEEMSNEELVDLAKIKDDYAASQLYINVERLFWQMILKYKKTTPFNEADLMEGCHMAFIKTIKYFDTSKGFKFTTYLTKSITLEYYNMKVRATRSNRALDYNSYSLNWKIDENDGDSEFISIFNYEEDFSNVNIIDYQEGVNYAMSFVTKDYKDYMIDLLYQNLNNREVAEKIGKTHQAVSATLIKFKKNIEEYVFHKENHRLVKIK